MAQELCAGDTEEMYLQRHSQISILQVGSSCVLIIFNNSFLLLDIPYWKNSSILYQENDTYFTAVLELGDMFYGGGVPIDQYIIQVEDGTVLETPGPTYSFDIMYNTSLSVNVSAHNCAGYSDPFLFDIKYPCFGTRVSPYYCSTELVGLPSKTVTTNSIFTNTHNLGTTNGTSIIRGS